MGGAAMAKRKTSPPKYRLHRQSGQAVVTLRCTVSGKRRDVLLGEHDTADSWAEYARVIAKWEAAGRVLDGQAPRPKLASGVSVATVMLDWWEYELARYGVEDPEGRLPSGMYARRSVVRLTRAVAGSTPAAQFGPVALQRVREQMAAQGWGRQYINDSVSVIIRAFRQAVAAEKVASDVVVALACVKPLRRGELGAKEGRKIKGVALEHIEAVKPKLSRQVQAIVSLMLLTGARCDEIVRMRSCDIELGKVWTYRPDGHKGAHRGHERLIHIGPRAQAIVEPFMAGRPTTAYLFSPAEAEAERHETRRSARRTPVRYGNGPGTNRVVDPRRAPGQQYTTDTVRRAIERACDATWPPPEHLARKRVKNEETGRARWETDAEWAKRLKPAEKRELAEWRKTHRWTPHQLRHTAATLIRREAGVEAAALVLGHASATLTDAVYAERDHAKAIEVIAKVG